jgi:predicted RNA-binding protein YlqC (UPF0109 family)
MVVDFVKSYIELLSFHPEEIIVDVIERDDYSEIIVYANKEDAGRIIGKDGNMIKSIKTVISGCKAKELKNYKISVNINE